MQVHNTSWVLDLTYIFRPHPSLFIMTFSTWHHLITFSGLTYHHFWYSFSVFSLIIAYSTLSLFHFEWWFFTCHYMEDCLILSPRSPHGQWFRDLSLRGCPVSEDLCYIRMWIEFDHLGMYFHGSSFIINQSMRKKKKKRILCCIILHWACFIGFMC